MGRLCHLEIKAVVSHREIKAVVSHREIKAVVSHREIKGVVSHRETVPAENKSNTCFANVLPDCRRAHVNVTRTELGRAGSCQHDLPRTRFLESRRRHLVVCLGAERIRARRAGARIMDHTTTPPAPESKIRYSLMSPPLLPSLLASLPADNSRVSGFQPYLA
uniref:Uncharacterized protein n=1 Tax=Timema cristinae TaxID=61476 RepID=A0A7R9CWA6_TIMCR|nr:unnamed protein product [Timema cristinae]